MATGKTWSVNVTWETISSNETWQEKMNEGIDAPAVTGGMIDLPQGGTRESHAAVIGGVFQEGSEAATYAEENGNKIIESILPSEIQDHFDDISNGNIQDLEFFLTNIMKNEYTKIAGEFEDNEDETIATRMVIDSLKIKLTISGMPTREEILEMAKNISIDLMQNILGGGSS